MASTKLNDKVTLTYFDIRGRGEPIRLLLEDAGVAYEDVRKFDWRSEKQNRDKYYFGQVPHVSIGSVNLCQSDAIMRYLARELGYYGNSYQEMAIIDMVYSAVEDIKIPYLRLIYGGSFEKDKDDFLNTKAVDWLDTFYAFFLKQQEGNAFCAGEDISFSDFVLYEMLLTLLYLDITILDKYPNLKSYMDRIESRPRIAAYLASKKRPLKVNGNNFGTPVEDLQELEKRNA